MVKHSSVSSLREVTLGVLMGLKVRNVVNSVKIVLLVRARDREPFCYSCQAPR